MRGDAQAERVEDSSKYEEHMNSFGKAVTLCVGLLIIGGAFTTLFEGMEGFMKNLQDIVMLPICDRSCTDGGGCRNPAQRFYKKASLHPALLHGGGDRPV